MLNLALEFGSHVIESAPRKVLTLMCLVFGTDGVKHQQSIARQEVFLFTCGAGGQDPQLLRTFVTQCSFFLGGRDIVRVQEGWA